MMNGNGGQEHQGEHVRMTGLHQHHEQRGDGGAAEIRQPQAEKVLAPDRQRADPLFERDGHAR